VFGFTVSRLVAKSHSHAMHLSLDFNIELYPLRKGDVFTLALASSLSRQVVEVEDGDDVRDVWRPDDKGRIGIETDYQYVMYGKVRPLFFFYVLLVDPVSDSCKRRCRRCTNLTKDPRKSCKFYMSL
jgi:hypothetical protein